VVEEAVLEELAPSLAQATANSMRATALRALTERLLFLFFRGEIFVQET
jgi:GAF domain-containing protein